MRLWHKDLIPALPRKQLLGQWRECCLIAKALNEGTLNHLLVNKVKDYSISHFALYCDEVKREIERRGYTVRAQLPFLLGGENTELPTHDEMFAGWHAPRYAEQCYYNLQEKYDCGGLTQQEFENIRARWILIREDYINQFLRGRKL